MTIFYDFTEQTLYQFYFWIALIALPTGLILLSIAWRRWYTAGEFLDWNRTNGTVQTLDKMTGGSATLTYSYEVEGRTFTCSQTFATPQLLPAPLDDTELHPGSRLAVLYHPTQPERARINPQPPMFPYMELALGGSAVFFGVISVAC
ncbi:MAG TPA: DUF3592 domain-containing protein, partial [Candidatus Methylacidiphilales bacterium]|nr:DUF3592 domain-containing protein [Candidatus Methylacidiphilales bacterium]